MIFSFPFVSSIFYHFISKNIISLNTNTSNPTKRTFGDDIMYVKGIEPFMVRYVEIGINIKLILVGIV